MEWLLQINSDLKHVAAIENELKKLKLLKVSFSSYMDILSQLGDFSH